VEPASPDDDVDRPIRRRARWARDAVIGIGLAAGLALGPNAAFAVDADSTETDRPDVANSATTVPPGAFQIESGIAYARQRAAAAPTQYTTSLELTLRAGLTPSLEVRLDGDPVVHMRTDESVTNVGDLRLGLKYRFVDPPDGSWWPALAILPYVKLPSAPEPIGSERTDFGITGIASFDFPADFSLDVNGGIAAVGQRDPSGYLAQASAAASLSKTLLHELVVYVELFYSSRDTWDSRYGLGTGAGMLYRIGRRAAVDLGVEFSLAGQSPDYTIRSGFSIRFGR
jgi:hypothetical protein